MARTQLVVLLALVVALSLIACDSKQRGESRTPGSDGHPPHEEPSESSNIIPDDPSSASRAPEPSDLERFTADLDSQGALRAHIVTSHGTILCHLHEEAAPITVASFVGLARGLKAFVDEASGDDVTGVPYFDDTIFHRVIPNFLIQGGDRTGHGHGGPGFTLPDEFHQDLRHDRPGVLSMANLGPNTGGSQFFITEIAAPHLDDRHTVFGACESLEVIRALSHLPSSSMNRPLPPEPRIQSIRFDRSP